MSNKAFVVLGDRTTHGGTVITADMTWTIHGKPVARAGDMTVCPRCKGTFPIEAGAPDIASMGQAPARFGDKTECGATLLAAQAVAWWSDQSSVGGAGGSVSEGESAALLAGGALPPSVDAQTPTLCLECLERAQAAGASLVGRG